MSRIHSVQVLDYFPNQPGWRKDSANSDTFTSTYKPDEEGLRYTIGGIQLFVEHTARTNIMIRGADGRFISYKDECVPVGIHDAVASLKPFPCCLRSN